MYILQLFDGNQNISPTSLQGYMQRVSGFVTGQIKDNAIPADATYMLWTAIPFIAPVINQIVGAQIAQHCALVIPGGSQCVRKLRADDVSFLAFDYTKNVMDRRACISLESVEVGY